jgi:2-polyprenyl-6-methoxyphenol hydroxylase-like FAD-dependent oxidoreductase
VVASASYSAAAREIARGRLVLVGDAASCCHPLTATGLTVCASDAVRLRDAVRDAAGDFSRALPLYARHRRAPQRTRLVLARALYDVFCAQTPESRLMRDGLAEYWNGHGQRQAKSMALLSMAEGRLRVLLMEVAHFLVSSFGARMSGSRALLGLSRLVLRHAGETLRTT